MPFSTAGGTDNKAIHELRDELRDLNYNLKNEARQSSKLSMANFALASAMFLLGIFQFTGQIFDRPEGKFVQWSIYLLVLLLMFTTIAFAGYKIFLLEEKKRD